MKTYRLRGPHMLEPMWFNRVRSGEHPAVSDAGGAVLVEGEALQLGADRPAPGAPLKVWLDGGGFFVCATVDDLERAAQERKDRAAAETAARNAALDQRRDDARTFNARFNLPVAWDVGVKDVLSGLSETSWGDGRNKATVEHIYLLEPLSDGRITRQAGDFLCTSKSGSNGMRYSTVVTRSCDSAGQEYAPRITCKACLKLAERWARPALSG